MLKWQHSQAAKGKKCNFGDMIDTLFSARHITVKFANKEVFNNLNLEINKGRHWAVTGKSGSGKSVLLQVIAGNLSVSAGTITYPFMDTIRQGESPIYHQQFIAFAGARHHFKNLSNTTQLYYQQRYNSSDSEDALTAYDYLRAVKPNDHQPPYWTFDKTVAALNMVDLLDKQTIKLSNGETKRLMLAAALLKNPVLLLLDNPMTGLDVQMRITFNALLSEIVASGISVVMVTPATEIPDLITDVAVLADNESIRQLNAIAFKQLSNSKDDEQTVDKQAIAELIGEPQHTHEVIIRMRNVEITYGDKVVLNKINWEVKPGERWALLGPNGAGKSTLLSLVNGDNPQAYANDITLFDKKRGTGESIWDIKSKIGFVSPELYQYFPTDNSCLQVIESGFYDTLGLFRQSVKSKADLALKWMQALEIDQYARVLLKNIPASAQRLCLLARALIKNPPLLIFDEPCQGLDDHQQKHFKAVVDTICKLSAVSLIYVTHYQHEIPESVDKVLKLDKGEVVV